MCCDFQLLLSKVHCISLSCSCWDLMYIIETRGDCLSIYSHTRDQEVVWKGGRTLEVGFHHAMDISITNWCLVSYKNCGRGWIHLSVFSSLDPSAILNVYYFHSYLVWRQCCVSFPVMLLYWQFFCLLFGHKYVIIIHFFQSVFLALFPKKKHLIGNE